MRALDIDHLSHRYGRTQAVQDFSLSLAEGEIVCLLGPSGCGKTTVLRLVAGLESVQSGQIAMDEQVIAEPGRECPPEDRRVGLVFQDYALFPHLSVAENIAFGLTALKRGERAQRVSEVLAQVGLSAMAEAYPHMLSGGQQQRVALARAMAVRPRLMLLDEPFSNLDTQLRHEVRDSTLHVLKSSGAAALVVTHDPEEAMFLADRIALMEAGRLAQCGTPAELYFQPANPFVASFFGDINHFLATVTDGQVQTPLGSLDAKGLAEGSSAEVYIRPEGLLLLPPGSVTGQSDCRGVVEAARFVGRTSIVHLSIVNGASGPYHMHARRPGRFLPDSETSFTVALDPAMAFVFPTRDAT